MSDNPKLLEHENDIYYDDHGDERVRPGLLSTEITLRDLFAAFSMAAIRANGYVNQRTGPMCECTSEQLAVAAYFDADAMLRERGKG